MMSGGWKTLIQYNKEKFDTDPCDGLKGYLIWVDLKETVIMFWTCEINVLITTGITSEKIATQFVS